MLYAVEWDDAASAARYFRLYRQVLEKKWKHLAIESESPTTLSGTGDDGHFLVQLTGSVVTSLEGAEEPCRARALNCGNMMPNRGLLHTLVGVCRDYGECCRCRDRRGITTSFSGFCHQYG